jgi:hypothetical protein
VVGLFVLAVAAGYIAFWFFVTRAAHTRAAKFAVVAVAFAIPFWDLPIGYVNYRTACSDQAGLVILAPIAGSDSILIEGPGYSVEQLSNFGFKTIEYASANGTEIVTFTVTPTGLEKARPTKRVSKLKISSVSNQLPGWHLHRRDVILSNIDNGAVVARHSEFHWYGAWWQQELMPKAGPVARCHIREDAQIWALALRGST